MQSNKIPCRPIRSRILAVARELLLEQGPRDTFKAIAMQANTVWQRFCNHFTDKTAMRIFIGSRHAGLGKQPDQAMPADRRLMANTLKIPSVRSSPGQNM